MFIKKIYPPVVMKDQNEPKQTYSGITIAEALSDGLRVGIDPIFSFASHSNINPDMFGPLERTIGGSGYFGTSADDKEKNPNVDYDSFFSYKTPKFLAGLTGIIADLTLPIIPIVTAAYSFAIYMSESEFEKEPENPKQ